MVATRWMSLSIVLTVRIASLAAACLRMTRLCASALRAYPAYGPTTAASLGGALVGGTGEQRVIDAAMARPPSESYPWPVAMSSAPRLA